MWYNITMINAVNFSGGRSSAVMTELLLRKEREQTQVINFMNTGMETSETLQFVDAFDRHIQKAYGSKVNWLEFYVSDEGERKFKFVDYATCARKGEPMIQFVHKYQGLPNALRRACTTDLKIKLDYEVVCADHEPEDVYKCLGFRADEPKRVARMNERNGKYEERMNAGKKLYKWDLVARAPLYEWGIDKLAVMNEISSWGWVNDLDFNIFDTKIRLSNCVGCFHGNIASYIQAVNDHPEFAKIWLDMERWVNQKERIGKYVGMPRRLNETLLGRKCSEEELKKFSAPIDTSWEIIHEAAKGANSLYPQGSIEYGGCGDGFCGTD